MRLPDFNLQVKPRSASSGKGRTSDGGRVRRPAGPAKTASKTPAARAQTSYQGVRALLNPLWCYYGFITIVVALTVFGLMMVFSSSSVDMVAQGNSPWSQAIRQSGFCLGGFALAFVAMRFKASTYRKVSLPAVWFGLFLQMLTFTPLGRAAGGNAGWIFIGGFSLQPAEVLKLALCIWLPGALIDAADRSGQGEGLKAYWRPAAGFLAAFGLIMAGKDLGTAMIIVFIGLVAFFVSGFPLKWFFTAAVAGVAGIIGFFVLGHGNRMQRIMAAYGECSSDDLKGVCYQSVHGLYAMASGGLTGVGLGNSREKWNYLPEAHNDFIFAVIGEETGFIGAVIVILAFVAVGWCMLRVALTTPDPYARIVLVCMAFWIVGQALINISVVLGLLPVMGLPLPFVSAGGTALVLCLVAAGVAVPMMRTHPDIQAAVSKI
ncbi:cell division protein FtsW [Bifidobacterium actinocoloniiforme DSM 22766]|uniref:Probable peptidoglycan glycosyltransferase FtsW n=2 Tax=Bifidobacterium actinocoloniiforme TaxID=638619 RepID=A0A086YZS1_9BIFI|nr:putative peptidoglycan glycosyltransferase FtsW [Bifidobacterium actinocoloniiforme]KFI39771.1 cell division protein FtsW [Bifidobacterium actinocoloniiforme DSM 22766]